MRSRQLRTCAVALMAAVALTGCTVDEGIVTVDPTTTAITATAKPPTILDADIALQVTATATAEDGTLIDLELRVHTPTSASDESPFAAIRPQFMAGACADTVDPTSFVPEDWSFVLIDYSAAPRDDSSVWQPDYLIGVIPTADGLTLAAGGILGDSTKVDSTAPSCERDKVILGFGDGTIVVGFPGDADAFTAWAQVSYGFLSTSGATLGECANVVTDAAHGETVEAATATERECSVGPSA